MNAEALFAQIAHDIRGSVGSMRLVMGAVVDEDDLQARRDLLRAGDEEALRLAAGLASLPALALAATDRTEPTTIDLDTALRSATSVAAHYQATVTIETTTTTTAVVAVRPDVLALTLPALLLLPCALTQRTDVRVERDATQSRITCSGLPLWPEGRRLAGALADANGWTVEPGPAALHLTAPHG